ncbi:MAG: 30S ribosomal protein S8 [Patescibacteria group bacterium]|nr:30S ribosomal protein S8 [Patescibacteria group bacterium]MDD5490205.1 30S ribosomal protein S8 [Patescibacteria group bacterium]
MITDPISDMLTRIRNASLAKKEEVLIPFSKMKLALADILKKEGFVGNVEEIKGDNFSEIKVVLKYHKNKPIINKIERVSTPGRRVYAKKDSLPVILNNLGIAIISTPEGVMTNKEAKKRNLGGEIICKIY